MSPETIIMVSAVTIFVIIAIVIIALIVHGKRSWKSFEESERTPSPPPPKPTKPESRDEKFEEEESTRVVTSFMSKKDKSVVDKAKTPSEAEFKLLMAWKPPTAEVKTCGCCGAEMRHAASTCPTCGQSN